MKIVIKEKEILEQFFSCFFDVATFSTKREKNVAATLTSSFVAKQGNERALDDVLSQNFSLLSSTHRPQHHENLKTLASCKKGFSLQIGMRL